MKRGEFTPLGAAAVEHARRAIGLAGLDPGDFALEEQVADEPLPFGNTTRTTVVIVTRIATGAQRLYGTGRDGGWPHDFERDLRRGVYASDFPIAPGAHAGDP